jgi:hypothetical protein
MGRSAQDARARPSRRRHLTVPGLLLLAGVALPAAGIAAAGPFPGGAATVGDVADGEGRHEWPDGRVYEGEFVDGARSGQGVMTWPDGRRYEGEFRADSISGEGRMDFPDGARYRGEWRDGVPHGLGTYRWPDRDRYTGEYVDGVRSGWGEFRRSDGQRYVGGYVDGERAGQGTLIEADGTLYRGRFEAGVRDGVGIRVSPTGSSLTLETWSAGSLVGRRAIRESTGCRLRQGTRRWMVVGTECIDGLAHGRGNAVSTDGTLYVDSGRFVLGRLVTGAPFALGQPPEGGR